MVRQQLGRARCRRRRRIRGRTRRSLIERTKTLGCLEQNRTSEGIHEQRRSRHQGRSLAVEPTTHQSRASVIVQIGRRFYPAARHSQAHKRTWQDRLYIVGEMPPLQNRLKRACYRTDHSDDGWHLLAWCRLKSHCVELQESIHSARISFWPFSRRWRTGPTNRPKESGFTVSQWRSRKSDHPLLTPTNR